MKQPWNLLGLFLFRGVCHRADVGHMKRPWNSLGQSRPTTSLSLSGVGCGLLLLLFSSACQSPDIGDPTPAPGNQDSSSEGPTHWTYEILERYPHDSEAFTQGLLYQDGVLYESTGLYGESSIRRVDLETGAVLLQQTLDPDLFGEGLALVGNNLIQLTWQNRLGLVYDHASLALEDQFTYETEGWGITFDGTHLLVSDGTATLQWWDPITFERLQTLTVTDVDLPVDMLNELEMVNGVLFANLWLSDDIAVIDPATGLVTRWLHLEGLLSEEEKAAANVLNGIAYDAAGDRLFVTGKLWPWLFQIQLIQEAR